MRGEVGTSKHKLAGGVARIGRDIRLAAVLLMVVFISVSAATAWQIGSARQRALAEINTSNLNLAQALNTYTDGIMTQSAMLLMGVAERLDAEGYRPEHLQRLQRLIASQERLLHQLDGLIIIDAQGHWLMSSSGSVPAGTHSADRGFFIHHRDHPSAEVFIGPPIRSRSTGDWVITVSRRLQDKAGQFAGVVVLTLDIENFLHLFGKMDVGSEGVIGLATAAGQLLVRHPYREQDVGHDFSKSPNFRRHYTGAMSGTASFRSGLDGTERLYAFRKSDRYPIIVTVAVGQNEALRAWMQQALRMVAVVSSLLIVVAAIGWRLLLDIRRRLHAETSLAASREDLLRANQQLELLAAQDPLTGLANRRRFDAVLSLEARRATRDGHPLALLLIDLDNFKGFNDSYGHVAGDQCLQAVATALQHGANRPGDLAARYGGEELAVILSNTDLTGALDAAQRLLERINGLDIRHAASPHGHVTASIGVAVLQGPRTERMELQLVEAADLALYQAKEAGRNRVVAAR